MTVAAPLGGRLEPVGNWARATVPGRPEQKGSMRVGRHGQIFSANPRLKDWQQRAALAYAAALAGEPPLAGPVSLLAEFRFARPASHFTKTGNLRAGAPAAPGRPDLDKLLRALLDALTGVAFLDDAQLVDLDATKAYHSTPGVLVNVRAYNPRLGAE